MLQLVGILTLQGIGVKAVLATTHLGNREITLLVSLSPEDVTLTLRINILVWFSEDNLQTGRSEAVGHLNAPCHRSTISVVQIVAEPTERPLLLLLGSLLSGIGNHLLTSAFIEVHEERTI